MSRTVAIALLWVMLSTGQAQAQTKNLSERFDEGAMLPVHSALLTPGPVKARASHMPGLPAFFLVGDDVRSRSWLKQRLPTLQRLNAVGIVVQVSSTKALKDLRALAPGLTLSPASADDLAQRLGLKHYPVLISGSAIEQ